MHDNRSDFRSCETPSLFDMSPRRRLLPTLPSSPVYSFASTSHEQEPPLTPTILEESLTPVSPLPLSPVERGDEKRDIESTVLFKVLRICLTFFTNAVEFLYDQRGVLDKQALFEEQQKEVEVIILRVVLTYAKDFILGVHSIVQQLYVKIICAYFSSINDRLSKERVSAFNRYHSNNSSLLAPLKNTNKTMDYLRVVFHDTPEIFDFLSCLATMESFEESLVPFPETRIEERGGFFNRGCKTYEITNPLDASLFALLERFRKIDLYPIIVGKIHDNLPSIKFALSIVLRALQYHEKPEVIAEKIHNIYNDVYSLGLNIVYQWLVSLNGQEIQSVFGGLLKKVAAFNEQLPNWINQMREDLIVVKNPYQNNRRRPREPDNNEENCEEKPALRQEKKAKKSKKPN